MGMSTPGGVPATRAVSSQPRLPRLTILFIDPDRASAERLAQYLSGPQMIAIVPSAQAARAAIAARVPDLVVTELNLPGGDGIELIASLHAAPATRHTLLMVTTTRASVRDKIAALQAGADDYLVKPVDPAVFETHVLLVSRFRRVIRG